MDFYEVEALIRDSTNTLPSYSEVRDMLSALRSEFLEHIDRLEERIIRLEDKCSSLSPSD